jgi:hypothetical protein
MLIGLCLTTSTIQGYLRRTFAISTSLSLRSSHFSTYSTPNVYSKDFLKRIVVFIPAHGVWRKRREATSARLSAAPYSAHHKLYSEAVVSSAAALAEVGQFKEAVQYVQKAAKALYEAAKEAFERVKVSLQRLAELFVEAVARVLAWVDEHKAYLFLMAAVAAGVVALSVALNLWGLVELKKLAYAVSAPFVAGLADAGGRAAERFRTLAERYEKWKIDENAIDRVLKAPQSGKRPYGALLELAESANLPKPLVELRRALTHVQDEVEKDAAVIAALVLYKTLINNAGAYREWAGWYEWARDLVEEQKFAVAAEEVERLREVHRRLEEAAEEVRRELNSVLALYALHSRDLYEKLRPHLEVDVEKAEELAEARRNELRRYSNANMVTKACAALLSIARGGIYGHAAMLLMAEGALADVVLLTPMSAYKKADRVAKRRGEGVDPSRSRRGAKAGGIAGGRGGAVDLPHVEEDWGDRAASMLLLFLIGYGEADLKFRRIEKGDEKGRVVRGFQVFRTYGGVEAPVGELWMGKVARFNVSKEELRRFVEEAKRMVPDLSGIKKMRQTLEWFNTDVTFDRGWIVAGTADTRQAAWYVALFGEPESISGGANVTKEGVRPFVIMRWRREVLDHIIAAEGKELEPLLGTAQMVSQGHRGGRTVKSWRELVDAIDWSWVLKRVEEMAGALKPWIGPEKMGDVEREELVRRMLGELALLAHYAEARRGKDDSKWREERVKRLAMAVEELSGGRIAGEYAERLAKLIIRYAERRVKRVKKSIESLAKVVGVSSKEVWGIVDFVVSDMYCLARDCARDAVVRKFVAPALELVMLDKALNNKFDRERARLLFGEMYATAVAGDGYVGSDDVKLVVGGELGGGVALLRLATLHLLNQLLSDELKFNARIYMGEDRYYNITSTGENAARFMRFLAVSAPSAGWKYLSDKFNEFVKAARVEVRLDKDSIRLTDKGRVAADLTISEADVAVKYNVYLHDDAIELEFKSTDRSRVELAAILLRHAGIGAEVKEVGDGDMWRVRVTTDRLASGHEKLRNAIAEIVREAIARGWVDEKKAEGWLEKLERGRVLMEGWPKYEVGLVEGALRVRFSSPNPDSIKQEAQRFRDMGLVEGKHFTVKMPEEGRYGYVRILREGLERAAWLSEHGSEDQRKLAAEFVNYILQRAKEEGEEVYEKASKIIDEGKARGSLTLKGFEKEVEVDGRRHVVKVIDGGAVEEGRDGRKLLRIKITAEVDRVRSDYVITYGRRGAGNRSEGIAYARADAPGGREGDAERLAAVIKALTGEEPRVYRINNSRIMIVCGREHLDGFRRYAELADAVEEWLEETSRRIRRQRR